MTIRSDSDLDRNIQSVLDHDRDRLNRFASTPNSTLLANLVGTKATATLSVWSLSTLKLWAVIGFLAVGGSSAFLLLREGPAPAVRTVRSEVVPTTQQNTVGSAVPQSQTTKSFRKPSSIRTKAATDAASVPTATLPAPNEPIDLDRWNTASPQVIQLPTKLEVQTRAQGITPTQSGK